MKTRPPYGTDTEATRGGFEVDLGKGSFVPTILSIAKSTRALFELKLAEIGLHVGQDQLLAHLGDRGDCSVRNLAGLLGVRASTVSKMAGTGWRKPDFWNAPAVATTRV